MTSQEASCHSMFRISLPIEVLQLLRADKGKQTHPHMRTCGKMRPATGAWHDFTREKGKTGRQKGEKRKAKLHWVRIRYTKRHTEITAETPLLSSVSPPSGPFRPRPPLLRCSTHPPSEKEMKHTMLDVCFPTSDKPMRYKAPHPTRETTEEGMKRA